MDNNLTRKAINKNTIGIVGGFPSYPHGIEDDIEGLSEIAHGHNLPLHVDCCLGGLLVAFYKQGKLSLPKFDYSLKGN
jgi:sphinganine-1-phosphate aldolase